MIIHPVGVASFILLKNKTCIAGQIKTISTFRLTILIIPDCSW